MSARTIVIGDIHGCHSEFAELLDRLEPAPDDRIILLGDLVNRGPDSLGVLDLARRCKAVSLLGNHEKRLLDFHKTGDPSFLKKNDEKTLEQLRAKDWEYLGRMPLTHELPEFGAVCVHGGFLPDRPWREQTAEVVTHIQVIDENGGAAKRGECKNGTPWADKWVGPPFVIYGHTPRRKIHETGWSLGIDTGCVLGGHLTAYLLPEKRFVQVKAHGRYHR